MRQIPLTIATDHPAYPGHFVGRPILPGVVLLDLAKRSIEALCGVDFCGLSVAKFHSVVSPGEALTLEFDDNDTRVRYVIRCADRKVADGSFTVAVKEPQQ